MLTLILGVFVFTTIISFLVIIIYFSKTKLTGGEKVSILFDNSEQKLSATSGGNLLQTLQDNNIFIASACGGRGICGACTLQVLEGGGSVLPTEEPLLTARQIKNSTRLACQVKVKRNLLLHLPGTSLHAKQWQCRVRSNHNVSTFIKELILDLPPGEEIHFQAGEYIHLECPPYIARYRDLNIDPAYHNRWHESNLWSLTIENKETTHRSYSLANYPNENKEIRLNVRIAPPPSDAKNIKPGIVSSYIFNLQPGDPVTVSGPFGDMHASNKNTEMLLIGGGAGMAPMRSLILDQLYRLKTKRKITFWYGARSLCEVFYRELFDELTQNCPNFSWTLALSVPQANDNWSGATGFIHQVALDHYLSKHSAPEDIEYYLCGPPVMIDACCKMLDELGVEDDNIKMDKFG